jgi:hypothetical protein
MLYAFSMPGKLGDALYSLPTIKTICERDGVKADFYTSEYCRPLIPLVKYQSYINNVIIPTDYVILHHECGTQPWKMPIDSSKYDKVFQLGFRDWPTLPLHEYIGMMTGLESVHSIFYEYPKNSICLKKPFVVIAPRRCETHVINYFVEHCPLTTVQIGSANEWIGGKSVNCTGLSMLETLGLLSEASAFIGTTSSLALANGFPNLTKAIPISASCQFMDHVIKSPKNIYLRRATGESLLDVVVWRAVQHLNG